MFVLSYCETISNLSGIYNHQFAVHSIICKLIFTDFIQIVYTFSIKDSTNIHMMIPQITQYSVLYVDHTYYRNRLAECLFSQIWYHLYIERLWDRGLCLWQERELLYYSWLFHSDQISNQIVTKNLILIFQVIIIVWFFLICPLRSLKFYQHKLISIYHKDKLCLWVLTKHCVISRSNWMGCCCEEFFKQVIGSSPFGGRDWRISSNCWALVVFYAHVDTQFLEFCFVVINLLCQIQFSFGQWYLCQLSCVEDLLPF